MRRLRIADFSASKISWVVTSPEQFDSHLLLRNQVVRFKIKYENKTYDVDILLIPGSIFEH